MNGMQRKLKLKKEKLKKDFLFKYIFENRVGYFIFQLL